MLPARGRAGSGMNERILVVDDTEAILDAVTDALAAEGFEVQGASDGKERRSRRPRQSRSIW